MITSAILGVVAFALLALVIFFMFTILFPALKDFSLSVENTLFSDIELRFIRPDDVAKAKNDMRAVVLCSPEKSFDTPRLRSDTAQSCALINSVYESLNDCHSSCIGLGDCALACPQDAINIENGCAVITDLCNGCGKCVDVCPKCIIVLMPKMAEECLLCAKADSSITSCDACGMQQKIPIRIKKGFKLWRKWYKMWEDFYSVHTHSENID